MNITRRSRPSTGHRSGSAFPSHAPGIDRLLAHIETNTLLLGDYVTGLHADDYNTSRATSRHACYDLTNFPPRRSYFVTPFVHSVAALGPEDNVPVTTSVRALAVPETLQVALQLVVPPSGSYRRCHTKA